jgi:hypothetical protein
LTYVAALDADFISNYIIVNRWREDIDEIEATKRVKFSNLKKMTNI